MSAAEDIDLAHAAVLWAAEEARTDSKKFFEFVMRREHDGALVDCAAHQRVLLDFVEAHPMCVIRMPVGTSKCVAAGTRIADPRDGTLRPIEDMIADDAVRVVQGLSYGEVRWVELGGKYATGIKECLRIALRTGRWVETTPEHPYLTPEGWRPAGDLHVGDTVALPRRTPFPSELTDLSDAEVVLLATLFAEGCTVHRSMFSTGDPHLLEMVRRAADYLGCDVKHAANYDYSISRRLGSQKTNPVTDLLRTHGLLGCKAVVKRVPPAVFALPPAALSRFLSVTWACDGYVTDQDAGITLASETAIDEIQHLLLRFGVQTVKRYVPNDCAGAWRLTVRADSFVAFADAVPMWGSKAARLIPLLMRERNPNAGVPVVSDEFQTTVLARLQMAGVTARVVKEKLGWTGHSSLSETCFTSADRGAGRRAIGVGFLHACHLAGITEFDSLFDVYWDEIESCGSVGEREVYDLTVPGPHNFVANDIIAHNTFCMAAITLCLLGRDLSSRGAIVSATQGQAMKPLSLVRDTIETSDALRMVFPALRRSRRKTDSWTISEITVDRPPGIRDPSLIAVGIDGALSGARLSWVVVDDILDRENTATPAGLQKVHEWFDSTVLSRLDPEGGRCVVTNTPWSPEDLTYRLEAAGWPTLTMDVAGNLRITNAPDFDTDDIVPSAREGEVYRLAPHAEPRNERDEVSDETVPLWPERYTWEQIETLRGKHLPHRFNQLYLCICRADDTARCKTDWIDRCKAQGRGTTLQSEYLGGNTTFTGVDLAVGKGASYDATAFFTFEHLPDGKRKIIDVEFGQWDAPTIVAKLIDKAQRYKSIVRVENNACFAPGSRVLTRQGYVPIEQIATGDEVWTHRARWRRVTARLDGTARMVCIARARGCLPVTTTPNHWFWLSEAGRDSDGHHRPMGEPAWISLGLRDRPAYAAVAIPKWPAVPAVLRVGGADVPVMECEAMLLGLFMAEGHATARQVFFTFARREKHLARFVSEVLARLSHGAINERFGDGTRRVCISSTDLARAIGVFGKSAEKHPPMEWFGWPLPTRLALIRGWLMGDGCLRTNNAKTEWPRRFFSGASISRTWMLFARTTLLEAGYRATISVGEPRPSRIGARDILSRLPIFTLSLNSDDSFALRAQMDTEVEAAHWPAVRAGKRTSNPSIVLGDDVAWARVSGPEPGAAEPYDGPVHNLTVEEDESYVVEDYVVHNAQDYIRQFARAANASIPIRAHATGRGKAHPEYGVEGLFIELQNAAWIIPCDSHGRCHPAVQQWVDDCLYYQPDAHTGDVLMAAYLAREQAREFGMMSGVTTIGAVNHAAGLATSLLTR